MFQLEAALNMEKSQSKYTHIQTKTHSADSERDIHWCVNSDCVAYHVTSRWLYYVCPNCPLFESAEFIQIYYFYCQQWTLNTGALPSSNYRNFTRSYCLFLREFSGNLPDHFNQFRCGWGFFCHPCTASAGFLSHTVPAKPNSSNIQNSSWLYVLIATFWWQTFSYCIYI